MAEIEIPHPDEVHEKAENPFTRQIALCVAVYAVGLAIASFGGHNAAKEMMIYKQEEARIENVAKQDEFNVWSQFQSKSTREALYKNERTQLEFEKKGNPAGFPAFRQELLDFYTAEERRMREDKDGLAAQAKKLGEDGEKKVAQAETEFKKYQRKDPYFDFSEVVFQIAIVLASVAMLSGKKWAFHLSLGMAALGALLAVNGFGLFIAVPLLDGGAGH